MRWGLETGSQTVRKELLPILLWILPVFANAAVPLTVSQEVTLDAEMRVRHELDGREFTPGTGFSDYGTLRAMLGVNVHPSETVTLRLQMKESRFLGVEGNNTLPGASLTLQQGYIRVESLFATPLGLQVGRFEMVSGRDRILGSGNWNVYGRRSYDGVNLDVRVVFGRWQIAAVKRTEMDQAALINSLYGDSLAESRGDRHLFVLRGTLGETGVHPLFLSDIDNTASSASQIHTAALYLGKSWGGVSLDLDAALQWGSLSGRGLSSWLFAAELKQTFDVSAQPALGLAVDITSGNRYDRDSATNPDHVFYAPYIRRHRTRGYMDYFRDVRRGLLDAILRLSFHPAHLALALDLHQFSYLEQDARETATAATKEYRQLGQEIDLRIIAPLQEGVRLDAGWCLFLPAHDWQPGGRVTHFAYIALEAGL